MGFYHKIASPAPPRSVFIYYCLNLDQVATPSFKEDLKSMYTDFVVSMMMTSKEDRGRGKYWVHNK